MPDPQVALAGRRTEEEVTTAQLQGELTQGERERPVPFPIRLVSVDLAGPQLEWLGEVDPETIVGGTPNAEGVEP